MTKKTRAQAQKFSKVPKDAREVYCNDKGEPIAFCPKDSIGLGDLHRAQLYGLNKERLAELLERAKVKGADFCAICIDVDDPAWTTLVDVLMPGHDWDAYRKRGETPVARGVVPRGIVEEAAKYYQAVLPLPTEPFIAVFASGGISAL
jgi:hypothetical protein